MQAAMDSFHSNLDKMHVPNCWPWQITMPQQALVVWWVEREQQMARGSCSWYS